MPNSLKAKLSKLRYDGRITDDEYHVLISKLDGHDKRVKYEATKRFIDEHTQINVMGKPFIHINDKAYEQLMELIE